MKIKFWSRRTVAMFGVLAISIQPGVYGQDAASAGSINELQDFYFLSEVDDAIRLQKLRFLMGEEYLLEQLGQKLGNEQKLRRDASFKTNAIATAGGLVLLGGIFGFVNSDQRLNGQNCSGALRGVFGVIALGGLGAVVAAFSSDKYELSPEFKSTATQATKELAYLMGWTSWDQSVVRNPKALEKLNLGMQERFNTPCVTIVGPRSWSHSGPFSLQF